MPRTLKVLIVEDDPLDLAILTRMAGKVDGDVTVAVTHCAEADGVLPALAQGFDAVLLDYRLGATDGLDVLAAIRASGDETPVLFVTSAADVHVASRAIKAGAFDYLLKSELSPDGLRRALLHAVGAREAEVERRGLEQRVRTLERMDAIAVFAGGIAHDFNNLLTGITGWACLALDEAEGRVDVEPIQKILESTRRAADLVKRLLDVTRRTETTRALVPLADVVRAVADGIRRGGPAGIVVEESVPEGEPAVVSGDRARIEIAVRNLCANAVEAMPRGGRLAIRIRRDAPEPPAHAEPGPPPPPPLAVVEVEDEGVGIAPEIRDRVYDAYFTTKDTPTKKGLGLGLTLVQGIARSHGGRIEFTSRPGRTVFKLTLPCATPPPAADPGELEGRLP